MKNPSFAIRMVLGVTILSALACGGDDPPMMMDGGDDAMTDAPVADATPDAPVPDATPDAMPMGCTEGCGFVELALGSVHSCARRENGEVYCWGGNEFGQLGDGRMRHAGADCTPAGALDPRDCSATPVRVFDVTAERIVASGGASSCAIVAGSQAFCWGLEALPPMGGDRPSKRFTAVQIEGFDGLVDLVDNRSAQCAIMADGSVRCQGNSDSGQLGMGDTMEVFAPLDVPGLSSINEIRLGQSGGQIACARSGTSVWCAGANRAGQLGDGLMDHGLVCGDMRNPYDCSASFVPSTITGQNVEELATGAGFVCARLVDGTVSCWGSNGTGQLGQDPATLRQSYAPVSVPGLDSVTRLAAGASHICALKSDGSVVCWGGNEEGQLGDGMLDHPMNCMPGSSFLDCSSTPVTVTLPSAAVTIASGLEHSCAILMDGEIYCWGYNDQRQLGDGSRERQAAPVQVMGLPD